MIVINLKQDQETEISQENCRHRDVHKTFHHIDVFK